MGHLSPALTRVREESEIDFPKKYVIVTYFLEPPPSLLKTSNLKYHKTDFLNYSNIRVNYTPPSFVDCPTDPLDTYLMHGVYVFASCPMASHT